MKDMKEHHFKRFFDLDYPICICTDDTGVFDTDITNEFYKIFKAFDLKIEDCWRYLRRSTECIISQNDREEALKKIEEFIRCYKN
jgi:adenosine deaminase